MRPLDALRQSSDQIRRAADLLEEIASDTADLELPRGLASTARQDEAADQRQNTILQAQRSFVAGLRLSQDRQDGPPT